MKKFLAFAAAGVLVLSMAGCGNKDNEPATPDPATVTEGEGETETEPETEPETVPETDPVDVAAAEFNYVQDGIGLSLPDGFNAEEYNGGYIKVTNDNNKGVMLIGSKSGEAGDDFMIVGEGRDAAMEDTEAEDIASFTAGSNEWHGYSFEYYLFGKLSKYDHLASDTKDNGQYLLVRILKSEDDKVYHALEDDDVQYILSNVGFAEE